MQTELKQIGLILLLSILLLNLVSEDLWAQPETANSDRVRRLLPQAGAGAGQREAHAAQNR